MEKPKLKKTITTKPKILSNNQVEWLKQRGQEKIRIFYPFPSSSKTTKEKIKNGQYKLKYPYIEGEYYSRLFGQVEITEKLTDREWKEIYTVLNKQFSRM